MYCRGTVSERALHYLSPGSLQHPPAQVSSSLFAFPLPIFLFESRPTPEISWTKVSGDLPAKRTSFLHYQKTLRIVNVSESDAGDYRCTARNRLGSVHHTIRVAVKGESVVKRTVSGQARPPCGRTVTPSFCHLIFPFPPSHN